MVDGAEDELKQVGRERKSEKWPSHPLQRHLYNPWKPTTMGHVPILAWILFVVTLSGTIWLLGSVAIFTKTWIFGAITEVTELEEASNLGLYNSSIDSLWYPPRDAPISDLGAVTSDNGVYGFIFNGSSAPAGNDYYGGYNYCNMPHVNQQDYAKAPGEYTLEYVEVVGRPHL